MDWLEEAKAAIAASSKESSIYVGCDSIRFPKKKKLYDKKGNPIFNKHGRHKNELQWYARYSMVVIVHMDSKHGAKVFKNTVEERDYGEMKQRLLNESHMAVNIGVELLDVLDGRHMEIHLDINSDDTHASNVAVKEALGYVMGMGMEAKIKPEAFAATHCADHAARGKFH